VPGPGGIPRRVRSASWPALAVAGNGLVLFAFVRLPWASGAGVLKGRDFTGPALARLARNLDLLLPAITGGPAAWLFPLLLYGVPVAAVAGALLALARPWSRDAALLQRGTGLAGLIALLLVALVAGTLLAGPAAGAYLSQRPGIGLLAALGGTGLALLSGIQKPGDDTAPR